MTFIEENIEHEVTELICLKCLNRAIHVYPEKILLKELECKCGEIGYLIKTGQTLPDVDAKKFEHDARFQSMVRMWGKKVAIEKYKAFVLGQE